MSQDAAQIKERIISLINSNGPSLPVQIARGTGLSILFASAFLSELFNDKEIKMSNMRVGSSPLYFLAGQESQMEKFSQYLKSKEKEAYMILKEKNILKDSEQQPAIRVALREIKDFAIPFEKNNEVFWRYFLIEEPSDFAELKSVLEERSREPSDFTEESLGINKRDREQERIEFTEEKIEINEIGKKVGIGEEIFQKEISENNEKKEAPEIKKEVRPKEKNTKKPKEEKKPKKQNKNEKKDDNFFNKIKDFLSKENIEILDIKDFRNNEAVLKIKKGDREELFFAFNKKKITEKEILDAHKKAAEENMPYNIFSLGETTKKLSDLISAIKSLSNIGKIE